jgi:hypothetical protein
MSNEQNSTRPLFRVVRDEGNIIGAAVSGDFYTLEAAETALEMIGWPGLYVQERRRLRGTLSD